MSTVVIVESIFIKNCRLNCLRCYLFQAWWPRGRTKARGPGGRRTKARWPGGRTKAWGPRGRTKEPRGWTTAQTTAAEAKWWWWRSAQGWCCFFFCFFCKKNSHWFQTPLLYPVSWSTICSYCTSYRFRAHHIMCLVFTRKACELDTLLTQQTKYRTCCNQLTVPMSSNDNSNSSFMVGV